MYNSFSSSSDSELIRLWGQKLKLWRLEANLSQTDLADKTGLSRSSIAEIEKGRNFSVASLIAILRVLKNLDRLESFLQEEQYVLSPMEIYEREQNKRKRGGYKK
jgi:transcriptional regulator with XRE-family HTH domain